MQCVIVAVCLNQWGGGALPDSSLPPPNSEVRGGTKSLKFHMIFVHTLYIVPMHVIVGMSPLCGSAKERIRDPWGISSSNIIVSITDHSHTFCSEFPREQPLITTIKLYYHKATFPCVWQIYANSSNNPLDKFVQFLFCILLFMHCNVWHDKIYMV